MIKDSVMYGLDAFVSAYYIVLDEYETETDPEKKEVLQELIDLYQHLHQIFLDLEQHRQRSEQLRCHEY